MRTRFGRLAIAAIVLGFAAQGFAASLILNGSFETAANGYSAPASGSAQDLSPSSNPNAIANWTVIANDVAWLYTGDYGGTSEDGTYFIDLTGLNDQTPQGTIQQTVTLTPGTPYALSFYVGSDYGNSLYGGNKEIGVSVNGGTQQTFTTTFNSNTTGNIWQQFTYDFTPTVASNAITFEGLNAGTGYQYLGLDNITLVPEPTLLCFLSIAALMVVRRRRCARSY